MKRNSNHLNHRSRRSCGDRRTDAVFSGDTPALVQRMAEIGMTKETAIWLIELYGTKRVKRQLDDLSYYLRAAIEEDWEARFGDRAFPYATKRGEK